MLFGGIVVVIKATVELCYAEVEKGQTILLRKYRVFESSGIN